MVQIIPAILTDSPVKFKDLILRIEPYSKRVHVDIADGGFVPNKTVSVVEMNNVETALKFDVHLMVLEPERWMKESLYTRADRFIIHAESKGDIGAVIEEFHKNDRKVGLALNPLTDTEKIEPFIGKADFVQFMTVHPGFQGAQFVPEVVDKISAFHKKNPGILIMCDGAITPETAPIVNGAGATELVSGSYLVKSDNMEKAIKDLEASIKY